MSRKKQLLSLAVMVLGVFILGSASYSIGSALNEEANLFMVSHSEYRSGEQGQIIGKLFNFQGDPIIVDNCTVTIYNPDKSIYLAPTLTDNTLEATDGTHYINFTTPSEEGVYEYKIVCSFPQGATTQTRTVSNSFHLNPALNTITDINASIQGFTAYLTDINTTTTDTNVIVNQINTTANTLLVNQGTQIAYLTDINNTVYDIYGQNVGINATLLSEFNQIQVNLSYIIDNLNTVNANVFDDTDAFNNFTVINNNFNTVFSELNDIQTNLTDIINFCDGSPTLDSQLCQWVQNTNTYAISINDTLTNVISVKLDAIDATTTNTYNLLSVNITNSLNGIALDVSTLLDFASDINGTVNRIESNVSTVITNQEQQVYISVFS